MDEYIIEIKNLTKYYGDILGIKDLSLKLKKGEIFGFIGPNGAGKSTTIHCIMNLINKTKGQVLVNGILFDKNNINIKEIIGYLPSEISLYDDLTVKQILDYHESFYKKNTSIRRKELVNILKLEENKKIEDLSTGNLKKVGIVLAMMHSPQILILDEPTSGLDPIMQNVFYELLKEEKKKGTTIFYSTHILNEVAKICDKVAIIKDAKLIKIQQVSQLIKKGLTIVKITSKDIQKIAKDLALDVVSIDDNTLTFANNIPHDELIKKLAKFKIDKILIEEASIEELLLHYYK